ncbi:molybdopterin-dependent oxidoreductase [Ramlibacter sp. G-1-2-2]|uniref:Molybdopterin-dependent oxidoreductase n=1 Tax=Ramlibacter agri TaxID=2728837 RepID=A0A848HDY1_9BURK|nr:molybdopterin-dependent oxidoreductase [Ramlibacter agri]NML46743.1 molybdopterin-dependent oxidoreductase [Ramlibacter agri]
MTVYTATHWGIYEVEQGPSGPVLKGHAKDPDPSPIGLAMVDAVRARNRVMRPAVRRSWAEKGPCAAPEKRAAEAFVEVPWDEALDLAAAATKQLIAEHGNEAVFGGSYGWSSAGRFHHAQSQVHRYLNCLGGYVRHSESYSLGAAKVVMPHILGNMDNLFATHTSWNVLEQHCKLFVAFGGSPAKNGQVNPGLVGQHMVRIGLQKMQQAGTRFINISPENTNLETGGEVEWIPIRPNTDTAMLLAIAHTLYTEGLHDSGFLARYSVGFDQFLPYLLGTSDGVAKTAEWAERITGVPAQRTRLLARELAGTRSVVTMTWALQRAHHGEQPPWALITVAAMLGQIGLPGGGFGFGYGTANAVGNVSPRVSGPSFPQGRNPVDAFIPCARIADMLLHPGAPFRYNGRDLVYPDIQLVYWAGGNPFHHHQDLNRLLQAWRKPKAVIANEQFWTPAAKAADIVFPVNTTLEREDIGYSAHERYVVAMRKVMEPVGESRSDYDVYSALAARLGVEAAFTDGRTEAQWQREMYENFRAKYPRLEFPDYEGFLQAGMLDLFQGEPSHVMLAEFRADPAGCPLETKSGRIEIFCETIASFGYDDCPGHPTWMEPAEWLGSPKAERFPLHMVSDQPFTKLHSQLDHSAYSKANKIHGREPVLISREDAGARGIEEGDVVRVFNDRGSCLAGARVSHRIRAGVVKLSTGAWFDPSSWGADKTLEKHGNPNTLTLDIGASSLSQGCAAQTCLVQVEKYGGELPALTAHEPPQFARP